jgi:hypothetical protein
MAAEAAPAVVQDAVESMKVHIVDSGEAKPARVFSMTADSSASAGPAEADSAKASSPKRSSFLDRLTGKKGAKTGGSEPASPTPQAPAQREMVEYINDDGTITR